MKVFVFDLLAYGEQLDHLKIGNELPYPLAKQHFKPEVAARTYAEHLDAWEELDRLGYDGVGFNEHHCSPYGLMNSPNLLAAAAAQRTKNLKLLIYGNLLPLHEPLRLAEELAMLDCMSNGRLISGFARGIPREYQVHNVPLAESRARFEEAFDIITRAWSEEVFSYRGQFWSYEDAALWPRPLQQPRPPIWMPIVGSKELIEFAAAARSADHPRPRPLARAARRHHPLLRALPRTGRPPDHAGPSLARHQRLCRPQQGRGGARNGPYHLYFNRTLFSHGNFTETSRQRETGYSSEASTDYVRPENLRAAQFAREDFRNLTIGRCRAPGRGDAVGHGRGSDPADHRRGRQRRRRQCPGQPQSRGIAARDVHRADPPFRPRGPAGIAGAPGHARPAGGSSNRLMQTGAGQGIGPRYASRRKNPGQQGASSGRNQWLARRPAAFVRVRPSASR